MTSVPVTRTVERTRRRSILRRPGTLIARRAASEAVGGWLVPAYTLALAASGLLIAFAGISASGALSAQDFGRTAVSLLAVTGWVAPLAGTLAGALAIADDGERTLLLVQPLPWRTIYLGRVAGTLGALIAATLLAWGIIGLVTGLLAGWRDVAGFAGVGGAALGQVSVGVLLGALCGAAVGRRGRAIVAAMLAWFGLAIAWDLVAIAALSVAPLNLGGSWYAGLLAAANPFDAFRVLGSVAAGGQDMVFGAIITPGERAGARHLPLLLVLGPLGWTILLTGFGDRLFSRRDR